MPHTMTEQAEIDALDKRLEVIEIKLGLREEPPTKEEAEEAAAKAKLDADRKQYDDLHARFGEHKESKASELIVPSDAGGQRRADWDKAKK